MLWLNPQSSFRLLLIQKLLPSLSNAKFEGLAVVCKIFCVSNKGTGLYDTPETPGVFPALPAATSVEKWFVLALNSPVFIPHFPYEI